MRGPIDYLIVGFEGNNFKGEILKELESAVDQGIISVLALAVIAKDKTGAVTSLSLADLGNETVVKLTKSEGFDESLVTDDDVKETADLLENNTAAGILVVEHLWAKPLKQAIINANGVLVADGRIHPDATAELNEKGGK